MKRRSFKKAGTLCALLCSGFLLGACENLYGVSAVSVIATDKTVADHLISFASNKDCSSVRTELGQTYCKEDDPTLKEDDKIHCYRELGRVTCYQNPDINSPRPDLEDKKPPVLNRN